MDLDFYPYMEGPSTSSSKYIKTFIVIMYIKLFQTEPLLTVQTVEWL